MIELLAGPLRLVLDPDTGGAVASFTHDGLPLLRPVSDARLVAQHGRSVAGYPLIPFANRVANGRFSLGGVQHQLNLNFDGHPHTIHGNAWMRRWTALHVSPGRAELTLDHRPPMDPAGEWPFAYHAEQVFTLSENRLELAISVRNEDHMSWPAGIGFHPYVAREADTQLRFDADTVWLNGADSLPAAREAVAHQWDFATARNVGEAQIDECYAGWGGTADVTWPQRKLGLRLRTGAPFDHLQLYTPSGRDFFGLEPVSNMPDAINRMDAVSDHGLVMLAPGERLSGTIYFEVKQD
jgi:aldose 1-epimerase